MWKWSCSHSGDDVWKLLQVELIHLVSRQTLTAFRVQTQPTGCKARWLYYNSTSQSQRQLKVLYIIKFKKTQARKMKEHKTKPKKKIKFWKDLAWFGRQLYSSVKMFLSVWQWRHRQETWREITFKLSLKFKLRGNVWCLFSSSPNCDSLSRSLFLSLTYGHSCLLWISSNHLNGDSGVDERPYGFFDPWPRGVDDAHQSQEGQVPHLRARRKRQD